MKNDHIPEESSVLGREGESQLETMSGAIEDPSGMTSEDTARLIHELRVHQIELEMQNDELRRIEAELEKARDRYSHLYDFAPVGYVTVNEKGTIVESNLTAATKLGKHRADLVGQMFSRFIHRQDQDAWYLSRQHLLDTGEPQSLQLKLVRNDGDQFFANLEIIITADGDSTIQQVRISIIDVTKKKQADEALRHLNETLEQQVASRTELAEARARQLQALAVELIEAEERERRRLAELLHGDLQQILAAARMHLILARQNLPSEPILADVEWMLEKSIATSRSLSHELSPPVLDHSGLVAALSWLSGQMQKQFGLQVELKAEESQQVASAPLKVFLFRSVQELLFNVVKHSGVKSASVLFATSSIGFFDLTVSDRGRGFNPAILNSTGIPDGLGLVSLRERASHIGGILEIESSPGQGSRFTLRVPVGLSKP